MSLSQSLTYFLGTIDYSKPGTHNKLKWETKYHCSHRNTLISY